MTKGKRTAAPVRQSGQCVESENAKDLIQCPRCRSRNVLFSTTLDLYRCRRCGRKFKIEFEKGIVYPVD